jgi:hypothetical protein
MGESETSSPVGHCLAKKSSKENASWEAYELR